jgi:hypothetical protein
LATGLLAKFGSPQRHVLGAALSVSEAATGFENFCREVAELVAAVRLPGVVTPIAELDVIAPYCLTPPRDLIHLNRQPACVRPLMLTTRERIVA